MAYLTAFGCLPILLPVKSQKKFDIPNILIENLNLHQYELTYVILLTEFEFRMSHCNKLYW